MRKIEQKMVDFLDAKLKENGLAQEAISKGDARTLFVEAAKSCVGSREVGGNNKGPLVELIQKTIGDAVREPWCMGFVQTMLAYAELKTSKYAPIFTSESCDEVWTNSPKSQRVRFAPLPGAIIIWGHYKGKVYAGGHTGILLGADDKIFKAVEGNTESGISPSGKVERDGGGVYYTTRSLRGNGNMVVRGFLKPF